MKWKNVTLIAYMLFSLNNVLNAQTYSVSGIVTYQSENNVQPLPFATVRVYNVIGERKSHRFFGKLGNKRIKLWLISD